MNIDDVLHYLAPLTPAVLPVLVLIWHRTRQELGAVRRELAALRQEGIGPDPRLDELLEAVDGLRAELTRLGEAQRSTLRLVSEREQAQPQLGPGSASAPG
jgi:hypothetical protein